MLIYINKDIVKDKSTLNNLVVELKEKAVYELVKRNTSCTTECTTIFTLTKETYTELFSAVSTPVEVNTIKITDIDKKVSDYVNSGYVARVNDTDKSATVKGLCIIQKGVQQFA